MILTLALLSKAVMASPAIISDYTSQAKQANSGFTGFSAERGKALYYRETIQNGKKISCAACHTADPRQPGKTPAFRPIDAMAPVVTPSRFTDAKRWRNGFAAIVMMCSSGNARHRKKATL
jgi:cytochrome c peroxidase